MNRPDHIALLLRCAEISEDARASGNTPFGALLAGPAGEVLLEQGNVELTDHDATGHAETSLVRAASRRWPKDFLSACTLYTTVEPCAMCAGAVYWSGIGRLVYGIPERRLLELTGADERNPTLDLPCREVFGRGQRQVEVLGPFDEVDGAVVHAHAGYWKGR
jgi:tRNA(Arg) A34 adenosine deaminase TadA